MKLRLLVIYILCFVLFAFYSCSVKKFINYKISDTDILDSAPLIDENGIPHNIRKGVIYNDKGLQITLVKKRESHAEAYYSWIEMTENIAYEQNLIFCGKVIDTKEAIIEFDAEEYKDTVSKITLFDVEVTKILWVDKDIKIKPNDIITILMPFNSYNLGEEIPIVENGKRFIIFCNISTNKFPTYSKYYSDYYLGYPNVLLIEKLKDTYLISNFFKEYSDKTISVAMAWSKSNFENVTQYSKEVSIATKILAERSISNVSTTEYGSHYMFKNNYLIDSSTFEQAIIEKINAYKKDG